MKNENMWPIQNHQVFSSRISTHFRYNCDDVMFWLGTFSQSKLGICKCFLCIWNDPMNDYTELEKMLEIPSWHHPKNLKTWIGWMTFIWNIVLNFSF